MRAFLHEGGELQSPRWRRLCASLKASSPGDAWRLYGHLCAWWGHWTLQAGLETGLWFDTSLGEVGRWAQVEGEELAWGRGLLSAGYIARIEERYPAPLGRQGFVALNGQGAAMMDDTFAYFRNRPDAGKLVLYISAPIKRLRWAEKLGLNAAAMDADGEIPAGWLGTGAGIGAGRGEERRTSNIEHSTLKEEEEERPAGNVQRPTLNVQRSTQDGSKPVRGFGERMAPPAPPAPRLTGTAKKPSMAVLEQVRQWKYQDPLRACMAMDNSKVAEVCWRQAIKKDREKVCQEIGGLVETDDRWAGLRNPASVLMASLRRNGLVG